MCRKSRFAHHILCENPFISRDFLRHTRPIFGAYFLLIWGGWGLSKLFSETARGSFRDRCPPADIHSHSGGCPRSRTSVRLLHQAFWVRTPMTRTRALTRPQLGRCNWEFKRWGFKQVRGYRRKGPFSCDVWIFQVGFGCSGKGRKRQKKGEKG